MFLFSDLMTYKETFQLFPQMEYLSEVIFLDDITSNGYLAMAEGYLKRINTGKEIFMDDDQVLSKSLVEVRQRVKQQVFKSFYNSKMLQNIVSEECLTYGAAEFVFPDDDKLTGNIFAGNSGFSVVDPHLRQTLLNMPIEAAAVNKHRFGVYLELFRFIYDILGMHLAIRKSYLETFLTKS